MKYNELRAIAEYFFRFERVSAARRVGENSVLLVFCEGNGARENGARESRCESWLADLGARIFAPRSEGFGSDFCGGAAVLEREFNAPFDQMLVKFVNNSRIKEIAIDKDDKILRISLEKTDSYKTQKTSLILEWTPNRLNALLLDENEIVIESMRRIAKLKERYIPPPKPQNKPAIEEIKNIKSIMSDRLKKYYINELEKRKTAEIKSVETKIKKIDELLNALESAIELENRSKIAQEEGSLILANLSAIAPYSKTAAIVDFNGEKREIQLEGKISGAIEADRKFAKSKRLKAKAKGVEIERKNLTERAEFYDRLKLAIGAAQNIGDIDAIVPRSRAKTEKKSASEPIEEFLIGGFRALLGRSERGNEIVLKRAKPRDIWFHLQNRPGAHLIVQTAKETVSDEVILKAALIAARFSVSEKGDYFVDYTKRQFVKIEFGAHVTYTRQKSVRVRVD